MARAAFGARAWLGVVLSLAAAACSADAEPTGGAGGGAVTAAGGFAGASSGASTVSGCPLFPADNEWNRPIEKDPVDPRSDAYLGAMNAGTRMLHPDFGSDPRYGIPWISVAGSQAKVPMTFTYADDSDPGPYPFPMNAPIEGGANATGDRHVLVVDRDACRLYEAWDSHYVGPGWRCGSGAIFDLRSNALRPDGWTSADAAGLPVLAGLARRDEVAKGRISHALRFTVARTQRAYVHPATHFASSLTDANLPPLGLRVRLKADYDVSGVNASARVILQALKEFGMFLADNGSDWYISGETNAGWNDDELDAIKRVPASAFEVVKLGTVHR
jgi:hypothetical protein